MVLTQFKQQFALKQLPLRAILIVPFVLQIFLTVSLTGYLAIRNGQKSINKTTSQLRHEISDQINQQILAFLKKPHIINQTVAAGIAEGQVDITDIRNLESYYWRLVNQNLANVVQTGTPEGTSILVEQSKEGHILVRIVEASSFPIRNVYRLNEQGKRAELLKTQAFDARTRPWYKAAVEAGRPTWSKIFIGIADANATIALSQPIYSQTGALLAVQNSSIRFHHIHTFLKTVVVGQTGQTFIIDNNGDLIASSVVSKPYKINGKELKLVAATESENPVIRATTKALLERFGQFSHLNQIQQLDIQIDNNRHFIQISPIQDENGINWFSVVVIPEADFAAEVNANTRMTILLCLMALVIATILGILTSRWISQPILNISQSSEAIANGAFDQTVEPSKIRELGILARSFNQMTQQLSKSFTELEQTNEQLEQRVKERTQALSHALQELQRTQSQMIQAEKMSSLGQLVAGVAHEINNPVSFIYGNVTYITEYSQHLLELIRLYQQEFSVSTPTIQAKVEDIDLEFISEDMLKLLASMKVGAERIQEIVKSLRTFSRLDEAEVKAVDIHEGLNSTLMILQHRLKANEDHPEILVLRDYGNLPLVECYPGQLNQVFMNILVNAIDAMDESNLKRDWQDIKDNPNQITIRTSAIKAEWVQIIIADNGSGMSEEVKQYIFNPFFTTKPVGKGTGMGMSISYQIITERHGGKIDCYSVVGEGTEFIIQIPVQLNCHSRNA